MNDSLLNISPVDGRYATQTEKLKEYFSEHAFFRYRLKVEILYLEALLDFLKKWTKEDKERFRKNIKPLCDTFTLKDSRQIREIEKTTNHDVKAVEYFLRKKLEKAGLGKYCEWAHFGLTSQDINNVALPRMLKNAVEDVVLPLLEQIVNTIKEKGKEWQSVPMLARTHGQPASPTTMGKEWLVFYERLSRQIQLLKHLYYPAKFGGATGNFNAHFVAFPKHNWVAFADTFINSLGLKRSRCTTQIDHYDMISAHLDAWKRIAVILKDFCSDQWLYISMDYFRLKIKKNEVGSSAMPHKVNPIDFENAEGNLGLAIALLEHLSSKLPVSRLQRDLTDSTVIRNMGVPFAHLVIAMQSMQKGISKLQLNKNKLEEDLDNNWAVVAEAIQTILRRENYPDPYNALKELTRTGDKITKEQLHAFIDTLKVNPEIKKELKAISPKNYIGNAATIKL